MHELSLVYSAWFTLWHRLLETRLLLASVVKKEAMGNHIQAILVIKIKTSSHWQEKNNPAQLWASIFISSDDDLTRKTKMV